MCTVTYLPTRAGYILTHNRDEAPARSPKHISRKTTDSDALLFPMDTKAGGAWIVAARDGRVACLLNGAFVKHQHQPPYRRSRGLLLLDFFQWPQPDRFFEEYDLTDIEPFTLLIFLPGHVTELRWDGARRHRSDLSAEQPHFWCSATLYPPAMQVLRERVFYNWLQNSPPATSPRLSAAIFNLHLLGSVGDPENDYVMNRNGRVCTVSVTQVVQRGGTLRMRYRDLLQGHRDVKQIRLL
ncbi:MAG: NRDE family protein [Lewinellaceae bacterium]|nr:NRDE family protein [Lewinellaceae bacterium]